MTEKTQLCLITSSHRDFWITDGQLLLLGQWCINGYTHDDLKNLDMRFAAPYGLAIDQRDADHVAVRALEDGVFADFCRVLNATHGVNHTSRYWRILTGQWFRTAVSVVFNRVRTLQECLVAHAPAFTVEPVGETYYLPRRTSSEALWAYNDSKWDGYFCLRILKQIAPALQFVRRSVEGDRYAPSEVVAIPGPSGKKKLLISAWRVCQNLAQRFVRRKDAFIINSYLPRTDEIKLQLRLGQFPQLWKSPEVKCEQDYDFAMRRHLAEQLKRAGSETVESVARELLFEIIPLCYLEGYRDLVSQTTHLPWPDTPKFIFTSNNFGTDELFKTWAAARVQQGVKYFVGQHGNNYGTHRYMNPSVEEATSDVFITWGWKGRLEQHTPGFNLKISAKTDLCGDPEGDLLLIQVWAGHRITTWDNSEQFLRYMDDQFAFVNGLSESAKSLLNVRLHHDWAKLDWNEPARWRKFDPKVRLDPGFEGIQDKIRQSRLVIHSYDSTGLLETLALGVPTISFWQNGLAHLRDEVKDDFQALVEAGIVHLSSESAASTVNAICGDVWSWWADAKRSATVRKFCSTYSRLSSDPARELAKTLAEASMDAFQPRNN